MTLTAGSPVEDPLSVLVQEVTGALNGMFVQMDWAEDEIDQAKRRHPSQSDRLHHTFSLLTPTHHLMATEWVYRAHCREMLERVHAGADTRPGTAAELCCACSDMSQITPLRSAAVGLYGRMWEQAFPRQPQFLKQHHHEALEAPRIDELEAILRRKCAVQARRLTAIECSGFHHGEPVNCTFAPPAEQLSLLGDVGSTPRSSSRRSPRTARNSRRSTSN